MGIFGRKQERNPIHEMQQNFEVDQAMLEQGWRIWPPTATEDEMVQAIEAYIGGEKPEWYPADYIAPEPVDSSGKLQVAPDEPKDEPEAQRRGWHRNVFGGLRLR